MRKYLFILFLILIYILLKVSRLELIPDWLGFTKIDPSGYFELILNITASVLGVLIAVVLLMFQMNKDTFLRRKEEDFLDKPMIATIIVLSLTILILGLGSYITIEDFKTSASITLGYYVGFLFVVFILSIFPAIKNILDELHTLKTVKNRIDKLTKQDFVDSTTLRPHQYISLNPDHTLVRIRHELIIAVRESDYEAYSEILSTLNSKTTVLIGDAKDRIHTDGIFTGLIYIWQESIEEAMRTNNHQFYKSLWEAIGNLYDYAATKKAPLLHFQTIKYFIYQYIQFLTRNNLGDALTNGVTVLSDAFIKNLTENRPAQKDIKDLYRRFDRENAPDHNINESIQWHSIEQLLGLIDRIQQASVTNNDIELYRTCMFSTNTLLDKIGNNRIPGLELYQEAALAIKITGYRIYYAEMAIKAEMYEKTFMSMDLETSFYSRIVEKKVFYAKGILTSLSDFVVKAQREGHLDSYTIMMFASIGRHGSNYYLTNSTSKSCVNFIVDTLSLIKSEIEEDQLTSQKSNYDQIKQELIAQKEFLIRDNPDLDDPILVKIDEIVSGFMDIEGKPTNQIVDWKEFN